MIQFNCWSDWWNSSTLVWRMIQFHCRSDWWHGSTDGLTDHTVPLLVWLTMALSHLFKGKCLLFLGLPPPGSWWHDILCFAPAGSGSSSSTPWISWDGSRLWWLLYHRVLSTKSLLCYGVLPTKSLLHNRALAARLLLYRRLLPKRSPFYLRVLQRRSPFS